MGDFGYIFGFALITSFLFGFLLCWVYVRARHHRTLKRKPLALSQMIKTVEGIIAKWDGTEEELNALIMLEDTVLYDL